MGERNGLNAERIVELAAASAVSFVAGYLYRRLEETITVPRSVIQGVKEANKTNPIAAEVFLRAMPYAARLRNLQINGAELPKKGAAIIVLNHESISDTIFGPYAVAKKSGRIPVVVMRDTLTDLSREESEEVLKRTGTLGKKRGFGAKVMAFVTSKFDHIPVKRGDKRNEEFNKLMDQAIEEDRLVYQYGQETRSPEDDLMGFKKGITRVIARHPDVPVYPVSVYNTPIDTKHGLIKFWKSLVGPVVINIGDPIFYRKVVGEKVNSSNINTFHRELVNRIAEPLPMHLKQNWIKWINSDVVTKAP